MRELHRGADLSGRAVRGVRVQLHLYRPVHLCRSGRAERDLQWDIEPQPLYLLCLDDGPALLRGRELEFGMQHRCRLPIEPANGTRRRLRPWHECSAMWWQCH